MKRTLLALIILLLLVLTTALPTAAHVDGDLMGIVPFSTAEPYLDGQKAALLDTALVLTLNAKAAESTGADTDAAATVSLLYTENRKLFVLAEIKDTTVYEPTADAKFRTPWLSDHFELSFDYTNYNDDVVRQYRCDRFGSFSYYDSTMTTVTPQTSTLDRIVNAAVTETADGYMVEMMIYNKAAFTPGECYGLFLALSDMTAADQARTVYTVAGKNEPASGDFDSWNYVVFGYSPEEAAQIEADRQAEAARLEKERMNEMLIGGAAALLIGGAILAVCLLLGSGKAVKVSCMLITFGTLATLAAGQVSAKSTNESFGSVPLCTTTIHLDGHKDPKYEKSLIIPIGKESDGVYGKAHLLYNKKGQLIVFVEVHDPEVVRPDYQTERNTPFETECVEMTIDTTNQGTDIVRMWRVDCNGVLTYETSENYKLYSYYDIYRGRGHDTYWCATYTDYGYNVEFIVTPPNKKVVEGESIGIHFRIHDVYNGGKSDRYLYPTANADTDIWAQNGFHSVKFVKKEYWVAAPVAEAVVRTDLRPELLFPEAAAAEGWPAWLVGFAIGAAVMLAVGLVVMLLRKRKKPLPPSQA